jgi:hypothetical protein
MDLLYVHFDVGEIPRCGGDLLAAATQKDAEEEQGP